MTASQLKAYFPKASESTIKANCDPERAIAPGPEEAYPVPQPYSGPEPLPEVQVKGSDSARILVRIERRGCALLDADNLAGGVKYHLDACRQCGAIPDDAPHAIQLEVFQTKVSTRAEECTVIDIFPLGFW